MLAGGGLVGQHIIAELRSGASGLHVLNHDWEGMRAIDQIRCRERLLQAPSVLNAAAAAWVPPQ